MSLAQLILYRSAKMMERLEATANLFYNLCKNRTTQPVGCGWICNKNNHKSKSEVIKEHLCNFDDIKTFESVCVFQSIILKMIMVSLLKARERCHPC